MFKRFDKTYCDLDNVAAITATKPSIAAAREQQRATLGVQCSDPRFAAERSRIDACLGALKSQPND